MAAQGHGGFPGLQRVACLLLGQAKMRPRKELVRAGRSGWGAGSSWPRQCWACRRGEAVNMAPGGVSPVSRVSADARAYHDVWSLGARAGQPRAPRTRPVTPAPVPPQSEACRTLAPERDKAAKHCSIQLPDGTPCVVLVRAGLSVKEVLAGLCERHGINGAAVDLFLAGGDKVWAPGRPRPGGVGLTSDLLPRPPAAALVASRASAGSRGACLAAAPLGAAPKRRGRPAPP